MSQTSVLEVLYSLLHAETNQDNRTQITNMIAALESQNVTTTSQTTEAVIETATPQPPTDDVVLLREPTDDEKISIEYMKQFTGDDAVTYRLLPRRGVALEDFESSDDDSMPELEEYNPSQEIEETRQLSEFDIVLKGINDLISTTNQVGYFRNMISDNVTPLMLLVSKTRKYPEALAYIDNLLTYNKSTLDNTTDDGWTALMIACRNQAESTPETVELLIKHGANVNLANSFGQTPLMKAVCYADKHIVKILIKAGADVNYVDRHYKTALNWSIHVKKEDITQLLINAGAKEIITEKKSDNSPTEKSSEEPTSEKKPNEAPTEKSSEEPTSEKKPNEAPTEKTPSPAKNASDIVDLELEFMGLEHGLFLMGVTKLMFLVSKTRKYPIALKYIDNILANDKSSLDNISINGWSALMVACHNQNGSTPETIELLIKHGANINLANHMKHTPLIKAICYADKHIVEILIKAGADVNCVDSNNKSALDWSIDVKKEDITQLLINAGAKGSLSETQSSDPSAEQTSDGDIFVYHVITNLQKGVSEDNSVDTPQVKKPFYGRRIKHFSTDRTERQKLRTPYNAFINAEMARLRKKHPELTLSQRRKIAVQTWKAEKRVNNSQTDNLIKVQCAETLPTKLWTVKQTGTIFIKIMIDGKWEKAEIVGPRNLSIQVPDGTIINDTVRGCIGNLTDSFPQHHILPAGVTICYNDVIMMSVNPVICLIRKVNVLVPVNTMITNEYFMRNGMVNHTPVTTHKEFPCQIEFCYSN